MTKNQNNENLKIIGDSPILQLRQKLQANGYIFNPRAGIKRFKKKEAEILRDEILVPTLKTIENELNKHSIETKIKKYVYKTNLRAMEGTRIFDYEIEINNRIGVFRLNFNYINPDYTKEFTRGIRYWGEEIDLYEGHKINQQLIINKFNEYYFNAETLLAETLIELRKKVKMRSKIDF